MEAKESKKVKKVVAEKPVVEDVKFLDTETRDNLKEKLKGWGIEHINMNDAQLLAAVTSYADDVSHKMVKREVESLKTKLDNYAAGTYLTDREFIDRLFHLNVPKIYLGIFRDQDATLSNLQLWDKVSKSGIKPIEDVTEILRPRYIQKMSQHNL